MNCAAENIFVFQKRRQNIFWIHNSLNIFPSNFFKVYFYCINYSTEEGESQNCVRSVKKMGNRRHFSFNQISLKCSYLFLKVGVPSLAAAAKHFFAWRGTPIYRFIQMTWFEIMVAHSSYNTHFQNSTSNKQEMKYESPRLV